MCEKERKRERERERQTEKETVRGGDGKDRAGNEMRKYQREDA